ncbi:hypothetical protein [Corynebacterium variabile]
MTEHRVHLLWLAGRGLHLWVERVEGHAVVVDSATLGPDDLAAPLLDLVKSRALRRRDGMRVATPKGQVREISLYTQAWTPEQALTVLGTLSAYLRGGGDIPQLSAETVWLVRLYELLLEIVDTGRVMMKLRFRRRSVVPGVVRLLLRGAQPDPQGVPGILPGGADAQRRG